jgi:transposase
MDLPVSQTANKQLSQILPGGKVKKRAALVEQIGADGYALLDVMFTTLDVNWLRHVSAVETLRRVWVQQFELIEGHPHFRRMTTSRHPQR